MTWAEVIESRFLEDLPFKIELNEWGQIVMTRRTNAQGLLTKNIGALLVDQNVLGKYLLNCSMQTAKNVKVADVVWMSPEFVAKHSENHELQTPMSHAPELCVEVVFPEDYPGATKEKRELYFEQGAHEVWFCSALGEMSFFGPSGEIPQSKIFPNFPSQVKNTLL